MSVATSGMGHSGKGGVKNAILIAGPTASGKSALAIELARQHDAVVVNADSMQVYDVLNVLTARPQAEDLAAAEHHLFGHVDPARPYSTGAWLDDVSAVLTGPGEGRRVIFVGGTGLYFKALLGGLSDMPAADPAVRALWRARLEAEGAPALHAILHQRDPLGAAELKPGRALADPQSATRIVLAPGRALLRERIAQRFSAMMAAGAADEVQALLARGLDPALPAMRAIGVREIGLSLSGAMTEADAMDLAVTATRQYAKRQETWFRNQFDANWRRVDPNGGSGFTGL